MGIESAGNELARQAKPMTEVLLFPANTAFNIVRGVHQAVSQTRRTVEEFLALPGRVAAMGEHLATISEMTNDMRRDTASMAAGVNELTDSIHDLPDQVAGSVREAIRHPLRGKQDDKVPRQLREVKQSPRAA
jgi:hypothetical protein